MDSGQTAGSPTSEPIFDRWRERSTGAVVVGDDGSSDAATAILWASEDAKRRGVPLVVIRGWSLTNAPRPKDAEPGYVPSEDEFAAAVCSAMADDVKRALGDDGVDVVLQPVHRPIEATLAEVSEVAAVTVVGARGAGLAKLLGSVSASLVRHARGPVVVVPSRRSP